MSLLSVQIDKRPASCDALIEVLYGDGLIEAEIDAAMAADAAAAGPVADEPAVPEAPPVEVKTVVPKTLTPESPSSRTYPAPVLPSEPERGGISLLLISVLGGLLLLFFLLGAVAIGLFLFSL